MAFLKSKPAVATEPFRVRTLSEASADYAAQVARDAEFVQRQKALEGERSALLGIDVKTFEADARRARVEAIATGAGDIADLPEAPRSAMRARFADIDRQLADLKAARDVLRLHIAAARMKASATVVAEVGDEYRSRVVAVCRSLAAAYEASRAVEDFRDQMSAKNIAWLTLVPISAENIHGKIQMFVSSAIRDGFVSASEMPEGLR
jgi:hypothetical protein